MSGFKYIIIVWSLVAFLHAQSQEIAEIEVYETSYHFNKRDDSVIRATAEVEAFDGYNLIIKEVKAISGGESITEIWSVKFLDHWYACTDDSDTEAIEFVRFYHTGLFSLIELNPDSVDYIPEYNTIFFQAPYGSGLGGGLVYGAMGALMNLLMEKEVKKVSSWFDKNGKRRYAAIIDGRYDTVEKGRETHSSRLLDVAHIKSLSTSRMRRKEILNMTYEEVLEFVINQEQYFLPDTAQYPYLKPASQLPWEFGGR